jgi:pimeloyl-ACP methyl ester carboxylesterase
MTFEFRGKNLHYKDDGTGNVIVLLHGYPESLNIWDDFTRDLSTSFRIVRMDLPGLGESESLADVHTMDLMAECVKALLDHLAVLEVVMIGHSMGGYVTLAFAELFPQYLRGFGLFHSMAGEDSPEGKHNRDRTIELILKNKTGFLHQFIPNLFAESSRHKFTKEIEQLQRNAVRITPKSLVASMEGMKQRPDRLHVLENSKVPVLFILGRKDSRIPVERIAPQIFLPAVTHLLFLGEIAHMGFIEARMQTMKAVKDFSENCYSLSEANHSA